MAVDYYYSWESDIGTFTIMHLETDDWELLLDDEFVIHSSGPDACITLLRDGLFNVDWGDEEPEIPALNEWTVVNF